MKALHDTHAAFPINVWVEDELTKQVLTNLWADGRIGVHVAGGEVGVRFAVTRGRESADSFVIGVLDSDFVLDGDRDGDDWLNLERRAIRLPCHEIENLLLDFDLLGQIANEAAPELSARAKSHARELLWWTACCATMRAMHRDLRKPLPQRPGQGSIGNLDEAVKHITESHEVARHGRAWARWSQRAPVKEAVESAKTRFEASLDGDTWPAAFPGKELLNHLRSHTPGLDVSRGKTPTQRNLDLGIVISREMRIAGAIPPPLAKLKAKLREKLP